MENTLITGGAGFVGSNLAELIKPSILMDWRKPGFLFKNSKLVFEESEFVHGDIRNKNLIL